jgi:hypothetical protein
MKAEQHLREVMQKYKNKLVYDANTGEIRDDRRFQTMLEDFWLPRREGGKGTEITTLPSGQNLGEIEDVLYFQKKFYKALNVPISRLEADNGFSLGRASEITRDELKFGKFIDRLRLRFSHLFDRLLETQLLLKGVCTRAEWKQLKEEISYNFISDSHFTEMKEAELMKERLSMLSEIDAYVGKYYSKNWVKKNVLRLTEEEVKELEKEMQEEEAEEPDEEPIVAPPIPAPAPAPALPNNGAPIPVVIAKESKFDDTDQDELAKSMTRFFDTLTEEANNDGEKG